MSHSIAQTRQQLSALIDLAQTTPQVITKHNTPVAVLVSNEYFKRLETPSQNPEKSFYDVLMELRELYPPTDDTGLDLPEQTDPITGEDLRSKAWSRVNSFVDSD